MKLRSVRDINVKNKKVLLRVDYNVPISSGIVGDPLRIESSFETIRYLRTKGCAIILISHLGRPDGKPDAQYSLAPVSKKAGQLLGQHIGFVPECVGPRAAAAAKDLQGGEIILLENTRFHAEEEANDKGFAKQLADMAEVFVDDAFAVIHRAHASTVGVTKHLPSGAGFLVEKEVATITGSLQYPARPLVAVIGGAKVSTKIDVLMNLINYVNRLFIGGAMANTFLAAEGHPVGKSKHEPEHFKTVKKILKAAKSADVEVVLPVDVIAAKSFEHGPGRLVPVKEVEDDDYIVDLGPKTVAKAFNPLDFRGSVVWNGPLGVTEVPDFAHNSRLLAENIIEAKVDCIIGGGDTAAFVDGEGLHDKFTWVSTGGGASLELMAGNEMPGLKVLEK